MIKRKIEKDLERFYESGGNYALLIDGARQVGKTYISVTNALVSGVSCKYEGPCAGLMVIIK